MPRKPSANRIRITPDGKIDLSTLLSDLADEFDAIVNGKYIVLKRTWYLRGTKRSCQVRIQRYVNGDLFSEFLGLYAADGSKTLDRVRFSNTNILYHKKVADILKQLGADELVAYVYYKEPASRELEEAIVRFESLTGAKVRGIYVDERAKTPFFELDVYNKLLAIFILAVEKIFRKVAVAGRLPRKLVARYFRGIIAGDGNIRIRIGEVKKGDEEKAEGIYLRVSEKNKEVAEDFIKILQRYYGVKLHSYGYDHVATLSLQRLLELLLDGVFPEKYADRICRRLLIAFKRKSIPWILLQLVKAFGDNAFTVIEASKVLGKSRNHTRESLVKLENMGYLRSWKQKISNGRSGTPVRRFFKLTQKAIEVVKTLPSFLPPSSFSSLLLLSFPLLNYAITLKLNISRS